MTKDDEYLLGLSGLQEPLWKALRLLSQPPRALVENNDGYAALDLLKVDICRPVDDWKALQQVINHRTCTIKSEVATSLFTDYYDSAEVFFANLLIMTKKVNRAAERLSMLPEEIKKKQEDICIAECELLMGKSSSG
ncbi:MAG: hypothetical protein Q9166_001943 [cf. Caloplaca sp. 2 TL-2023]